LTFEEYMNNTDNAQLEEGHCGSSSQVRRY